MNVLFVFYFPVIEVDNWQDTNISQEYIFQTFSLIPLINVVRVAATNLIGWRGTYCMRKLYLQVLSGAWHHGNNSLSLTSAIRNGPCYMSDYTNRLTWFCQATEGVFYFFVLDCCLLLNYPFNGRLLATNLDCVLSIHNHTDLQFKRRDYVTHKKPLTLEKQVFTSFHKTWCC